MSLNGALGLGLVFTAQDLASGGILRLERTFLSMEGSITGGADRIRGAFKQVSLGLTIFAAGAATLAGAFSLTSKAAEFEQAIAAVGAVSNASAADVQALEDAALKMGILTQYAPTEATKGLDQLAQAGFNARQSIALLKPVLDLAAGSLGRLTPETAAGVAVQALRAFRIQSDDASTAVDHMLEATNLFKMTAGDLPLALGHAADGANVLNQSLDETLIAFGLVNNIIPGVERASSSVSVSMERMADPRAQAALHRIGVAAADATGRFRPFLDIITDLAPKLDAMTDKDRASFLLKAFGHHALAGIGDILTQLKGGLQTDTGEIVKGADAIDYLRKKVANASGAAETFSHKLLDTLAGQEKLLHGSIETLEIMAGKAFADLFRPIVEGVLNGLNAVLDVVQATPKPIKRLLAGLVLAAGAFLTLVGGFLAVQGLVAVLGIAFEALGVSFGALASTLGLAMALLGILGVAALGLRVAWDKNLGGIADRVQRVGDVIRLVFQGISQLVEQGGFSGALREELGKAENAGIKQFLVQLWMVGYRLERFWTGLKDGFSGALEGAAPLFKELSDSFDALSSAVGDVFGAISGGAAELPSETFRSWGQNVGQDFAWLAASATALLSAVLSLFAGLVRGGRETFGWIRGAVSALGDALAGLGRAWDALTGKTQDGATEFHGAAGEFQDFGHMLGVVLGGAVASVTWLLTGLIHAIRIVLVAINAVKVAFGKVADFVTALGQAIVWFFSEVLPNAIASAGHAIRGVFEKLGDFGASLFGFGPDAGGADPGAAPAPGQVVPLPPARVTAVASAVRAAAAASPAVADSEASSARADDALASPAPWSAPTTPSAPITVNVQVDGETIARASASASRDLAGRSLSPVASY
ncbi:MAG: phage tail tape measure protein [Polyangiaceae bacterium]